MSDTDPLPSAPKGSSLERVIAAVGTVYRRIEVDQRAFLADAAERGSPLRCPPGCGACCEPFVPDILPVEAAYAAAWILERKPELAREIASWNDRPHAPPCPFLARTDEGLRCSIYPARFLICRLFGAAGSRDKEGRASFRPCAHMPVPGLKVAGGENAPLAGEELAGRFGSVPPIMVDYATEVVGLSPSEGGERHSLYDALPLALIRVGLCLSLDREASLAARAPDGSYSAEDAREQRRGPSSDGNPGRG
jgi:uncharacterized protein